ncbi:hypothetical protein [Burkholderia cenocepacia]|uniref:hypothetical protein n=1 Tax=Burkholderia cenocepacia TaxID=95486 RepID=UPI00196B0EF3|nr:hypothetical protein [Burkholderia cenocepacia]MBN3506415.1 hypothetical protein [Burkholderia cenocepacia]
MAASEIAMAASQVATPVTQAHVNWLDPALLTIYGTICGAVITAVATFLNQLIVRSQEREKLALQHAHEAATLAQERAPAQLEAALMLEAFARQAVGYLDAWDVRAERWLIEQGGHEPAPGEEPPWTPLTFDLSLVEDWSVVAIDIQSQCRELPVALAASSKWVGDAYDEWANFMDLHWLDTQPAILYGLQAGELATKIRATIAAPASNLATDSMDRLQRQFGEIKHRYEEKQGKLTLIPELKARLQRECPLVATAPSPALASADG